MAILPETENYIFGSGSLFAVRTDIANATPTKFGVLQDVNVEMSGETKMLYGSQQFPVAVGRGKSKITAACKVGMFQMRPLSDLMWGTSYATGQQTMASGEAHSVPASSTYTVTVTNVTGFVDYGVYYASSTAQLTRVASVIAIGTYSVTTGGVYTFYSGDAGVAMLFDYQYTQTSSGRDFTLSNPTMGAQPVFQAVLEGGYTSSSGQMTSDLTLYACIADKWSLPTKLDDFAINDFSFSAFANTAGNVFTWSQSGTA